MTAIRAKIVALADALTAAGLPTAAETPERATPPFRYVLQGEVDLGQTYGSFTLTASVVCVARPGTNVVMADELTKLAVDVLRVVSTMDDFTVDSPAIGEPAAFSVNGQSTLAAAVTVKTRISRAEMMEG